jgi:DNA-binding NarL/FixJ family response regulator
MFRECLIDRLNEEENLDVVGHAADATEALALAKEACPDVVLLDINMPGSPFLAGQEILRHCDRVRLVFLTAHLSDQAIGESLRIGARAFVTKGHGADQLIEAIHAVAAGGYYFVPEVRQRLVFDGDIPRVPSDISTRSSLLSPREREVLRLLAEGHSVKQVAQMLHVSYKTVDNQTSSVMKKLQIHSRAELVRYAIREKLAPM